MPFIYLFFFSCLIALVRIPSTMLNKSDESGQPFTVPDLRGKVFSFSPLSMILAEGLSSMAFSMLRYFPSILTLLSVLITNKCVSSNAISSTKSCDFYLLLMWCTTLINLLMMNHPCAPGMNPT